MFCDQYMKIKHIKLLTGNLTDFIWKKKSQE